MSSHEPSPEGQQRPSKRAIWSALGLALSFMLVGATQIDRYGVTWDEALGDFFFGERYFSYFTSFDSKYLDFEADPYPEDHVPDLRASPFRVRPWEYYPFANMLAAASSRLLSGLGLFDPLDGFHALNLFLGGGFVFVLFLFVDRRLGPVAAWVAAGGLVAMPRVFCHGMANIKDFPEMVLFSLTLMAFLPAWERGSVPRVLGAGALCGLALAAKANALFLAPTLLLFVLGGGIPGVWRRAYGRLLVAGLGAATLGIGLPVLLWPYVWPDPVGRIGHHLSYVSGQVFQVREESLLSPLQALLYTTPPVTLMAIALGLVPLVLALRRRDPLAVLLASWIAVTLGRMYLPGAVNFDGIRHFLELLPALMIVAGWGVQWLVGRLEAPLNKLPRGGACVFVALVILPSVVASARTHPHQIAYWNVLIGGTQGAFDRGLPQAGDYWGMSYRQGLEWINDNAPEGSILAVPLIEHAVAVAGPARLRKDIGLAHISVPQTPQVPDGAVAMLRKAGMERPVFVMYVLRNDWRNQLTDECNTLPAVAEWSVGGAPILRIVRYPAAAR